MQIIDKQIKSDKGFTLVEISMVMAISGLMLAAAITFFSQINKTYLQQSQAQNVRNAEDMVNQVFAGLGRYPCPADPNLDRTDDDFGLEDCSILPVPGARDVDGNGADDPILIGLLPTRAYNGPNGTDTTQQLINLKDLLSDNENPFQRSINDPWGNDVVYAVTESQTDKATYDSDWGAIHVRDEHDNATNGINEDAHFVIISKGEKDLCPSGVARATNPPLPTESDFAGQPLPPEIENCDDDAVFASALRNGDDSSDNYYDDYLRAKLSANTNLWTNIGSSANVRNDNTGKVVIGDYTDTSGDPDLLDLSLDVSGSIEANVNIRSDQLCASDGTCFKLEQLYNNVACTGSGEYIKSVDIVDNVLEVTCEPLDFSFSASCPGGMYLNGIFSDGTVDCVTN